MKYLFLRKKMLTVDSCEKNNNFFTRVFLGNFRSTKYNNFLQCVSYGNSHKLSKERIFVELSVKKAIFAIN